MLTATPTLRLVRRLAGLPAGQVKDLASRSWQIAPSETGICPRAFFLPGQLDRVVGSEFASPTYRGQMEGTTEVHHAATVAHLVENVVFADGVLYKKNASTFMVNDHKKIPRIVLDDEIDLGALYCTPAGYGYFGQWLMDDCVTYAMAQAEGIPLTVPRKASAHALAYEGLFGMAPRRVEGAFIRKLIMFDDFGQNQHKRARFRALSDKLTQTVPEATHPGVFVLRGGSGVRRVMRNERELAEQLSRTRGFRTVDHMQCTVPEIVSICAGAKVVIGVEGSHLLHGILTLKPGASIVAIMPPARFATPLKDIADRDGMHFGFVVGTQSGDDFFADPDEVERTLDLLPSVNDAH